MDAQVSSKPVDSARVGPGARLFRSLLLVVASVWFFLVAFPAQADPSLGVPDLLRGLAVGLGLIAAALVDWSVFRGAFGVE